ncbi:MAG: hypothetical protein EOO29_35530, partial [Comamonadaceae bacterium]
GANGAGKTVCTLKDVREQQLKENRPVFYFGFEPVESVLHDEFGWKPHEPAKWQDLPDGSILVWDECQNYIGAKAWGNNQPPDWVMALGQFRRKRGFDIWGVCPHPSLIHVSVRRLIANPSWHRHLKRAYGADIVSVIKYNAPNMRCEQPGSSADAEVTMRGYPKDVYAWYRSASLHTGKRKIPRAVYMLVGAVVLVPALIYAAYSTFTKSTESKIAKLTGGKTVDAPGTPAPGAIARAPGAPGAGPTTAADYVAMRTPRVAGFPHTAPAYDGVVTPTVAPYPAACVEGKRPGSTSTSCTCWTQQGTAMQVQLEICSQIVRFGFFVDWQQPAPAAPREPVAPREPAPREASAPAPVQPPAAAPLQPGQALIVSANQPPMTPQEASIQRSVDRTRPVATWSR